MDAETPKKMGHETRAAAPSGVQERLDLGAGPEARNAEPAPPKKPAAQRRRRSLAELLARGDPAAPLPEKDEVWLALRPVGRELL